MNGEPPGPDRPAPDPVVLVVDDEILIRMATADTLREEGFVALEAADAGEAIALLDAEASVVLVVTDVRMPGEMDGLALTQWIKQQRPHLPVVIVSGHLDSDRANEADRFLRKPVLPDEIVQVAKELIGPVWQSGHANANSKAS